jgi:organic radical activating enzyme
LTDIKYPISEIFESIQGEGNYAGVNSLFIRFQLCNLTCSWCDTKYSWKKNSGEQEYDIEKLKGLIRDARQHHVIFTGGEPSLYRLDLLADRVRKFHVESNGTIIPDRPLKLILPDGSTVERAGMKENIIEQFNWVISPKLSNSGQQMNSEGMRYWSDKSWAVFKFIIQNVNDLDEIEKYVNLYHIHINRIFAGIEGSTAESQMKPELVDAIIQRGFNYSPRLHIMLWGSERGR